MAVITDEPHVSERRQVTPGHSGWPRVATPGAPNKFFMASTDCHCNEPINLYVERVPERFRHRLPQIEVDAQGVKWSILEGASPQKIRDIVMSGEDKERADTGKSDPEQRLRDHDRDGIDAEIIFPGRGLLMFASNDPEFVMAQAQVWNDWAWEVFSAYNHRLSPVAMIATADVEMAVREVERTARMGFRCFSLPNKPIFSAGEPKDPNYNLPAYDRLWGAIQDTGRPMVFHVSTGKDPRTARGNGGAIINYAVHALTPSAEPVANLCCSGILERFPGLRFATVESGIGWVPWLLQAMDEAFYKHHFWTSPKLQAPPSEYYKRHGAATFQEDPPGLACAREFGLVGNFMWANDYPHHEGTWPHSAQAIERMMARLDDNERARILGLNAAQFFGFEVPAAAR